MKRKNFSFILCLILLLSFTAPSYADRTSRNVGDAKAFQQALDDGITDITITSSFSGNFIIPRWVYSISGRNSNITISPSDESKPVFDAESSTKKNLVRAAEVLLWWPSAVIHGAASKSTADTLKFSDLTILCGTRPGIDCDSLSKPVTFSNVTFKGVRSGNQENFSGCYPSTESTFTGCTFESLAWCIDTVSVSSYSLNIKNCTFRNSSQALSVSSSGSGARASLTNCKGENINWWVIQHQTGTSIMYVTVDQATINSFAGSDYSHKMIEALNDNNRYNSQQFYQYMEDLSRNFKALSDGAKNLIFKEQSKGWDDIRIYAMTELNRKLREADINNTDEIISLYALLACAPVAGLLDYDGDIPFDRLLSKCEEILGYSVKDRNLIRPIAYGFLSQTELEPLAKIGARISWGNTGNVRDAMSRIEQTPDRIFRENIHRLQDWLTALDDMRDKMRELQREFQSSYPDNYRAIAEFERRTRGVYDLGVAANRAAAAIFFDLPTDTAFAANFARVSREDNASRIIGICRELGSFYVVSQRLCVLNRTNTIRNEMLKLWKESLSEGWINKDNSKYEELVSSLATDPDIMRDATRINDFFREWK